MLFAALALLCPPSVPQVSVLEVAPDKAPYFKATESIYFPSYDEGKATGWTLADLVRAYEKSTGHQVITTPAAEKVLGLRPDLCDDPRTLPPERVQKTFEGWMEGRSLVLLPGHETAPRLIGLASRHSNDMANLPLEPYDINWTEADQYVSHVCTIFRTIVPVQGADARSLGNELRGYITDANVCQAVPLYGANCVLIQGPGNEVARLVKAFREPARKAGLVGPSIEHVEVLSQTKSEEDAQLAGLRLTVPARGESSWSLLDLCEVFSKRTGVNITVPDDVADRAKATLVALSEDLDLEGKEVPYGFEFLCRAKGFYLSAMDAQGGKTLHSNQHAVRAVAETQEIADLSSWSSSPARVVEVNLALKNFDPRILANIMRVFLGDPKIDGMKAEPGTQTLTMQGFAPQIAARLDLFFKAERMAEALRTADSNREE